MTNMSLLLPFFISHFGHTMSQRKNKILLERIATVIKALRAEKGVSQQDVFNDINIHIGRIETMQGNLSVSTLFDLCNYFNISMSDFHRRVEDLP